MKNQKYRISCLFLIISLIFFTIGCVSDPVKVDLSANHPANPEALEAAFILPPNPFQEDVSAMKLESATDSLMKHKTHDESGQKHMHHNMGTKNSGHGQDDSQHKEHRQ